MMVSMVKDCKTYFIFVDSLRYLDYKNLNQDSVKLQISNLDNTGLSERNDEFYSDKALLFFELKNRFTFIFVAILERDPS